MSNQEKINEYLKYQIRLWEIEMKNKIDELYQNSLNETFEKIYGETVEESKRRNLIGLDAKQTKCYLMCKLCCDDKGHSRFEGAREKKYEFIEQLDKN